MSLAYLEGMDGSYFKITSPKISDRIFTEDIISFSYTEENARGRSGTLSVYDPDHYYSKVLRFGAPLKIEFGYLNGNSFFVPAAKRYNPTELSGPGRRAGITAFIQNPKGAASSSGVVTYNCNFYGSELLPQNSKQFRVWSGMTKGVMIQQLLIELGVKVPLINFNSQNELLDANKQIIQKETNYQLLKKYAYEWRCIFTISNDTAGNLTGVFIGANMLDLASLPKAVSNAIGGDSVFLEYQSGQRNVLEYSWENHQGKSGSGDNVRLIKDANGNVSFIRFVTKDDTITAYRLNPDKIKSTLQKEGNFIKRLEKINEWMKNQDFQLLVRQGYFEPIKMKTAPQGLGYSMNCKMIGNPLMSAPLKVYFGGGFPVFFTPKIVETHITSYYCSKITHTIDASGYFMDLEIADAFTASGGMLVG